MQGDKEKIIQQTPVGPCKEISIKNYELNVTVLWNQQCKPTELFLTIRRTSQFMLTHSLPAI